MKEKNQLLLLVNTLRFSQHIPNKLKVSSVNMLILACSVLNFFDDFLYLRAVLLSYNQSYNAIVIQRKLNKHNKKRQINENSRIFWWYSIIIPINSIDK